MKLTYICVTNDETGQVILLRKLYWELDSLGSWGIMDPPAATK